MGPTEYGKTAYYNREALNAAFFPQDKMSSIMIPMGVSAQLYDADGFVGTPYNAKGRAWLDSDQTMHCENLPSGYNDRISSMTVSW